MTTTTEYKLITSMDDWHIAAQLRNANDPERPTTAEQMCEWAAEMPADAWQERAIVVHDNQPIAYTRIIEPFWLKEDRHFSCEIRAPHGPDELVNYRIAFNVLSKRATQKSHDGLDFWARTDRPEVLSFLESMGFKPGQRNPESLLRVDSFDRNSIAGVADLESLGYEVVNLVQYADLQGPGWEEQYWKWEMEVMRDVPMPGEFEEMPFESYQKMLHSSTLSKEGYLVCLADGKIAASTQLNVNTVDRELANTGLTGVVREHRRKGIAKSLKVRSLSWAKSVGIRKVFTDNELNNPMYNLNVELGFTEVMQWVNMRGPSQPVAR